MLLPALLSLVVLQQPISAPAPQTPIAKVDVQPSGGEVPIGGKMKFTARALDASGQVVPGAEIGWFVGGDVGGVDSTGEFTGGYQGYARVTAVGFIRGVQGSQVFGAALVHVLPEPPARIVLDPRPDRLVAGSRLTVVAAAFSRHGDRRSDPVTFTSSNPRVATVTNDGRLRALSAGRATITATAGPATETFALQVLPNNVARLTIEPGTSTVRTGDVVKFSAVARTAAGRPVGDVATDWGVAAGPGASEIDPSGTFVAELAGDYTVTASIGGKEADAVVHVAPREVGRGIEVRGRVPIKMSAAEVWLHPSGTCAYLSTIADRVYAIDITDVTHPRIVDSMMTNARIVNDVMTTEDGKYGVFSREGASDRKNGIVVFDASNPCHPKPVSEYTQTVSGGVHSSYVYKGYAYITDDATGSMRVIDIQDPQHPKEVARWQTEQTEAGRYLHDIMVVDGLAYLAYWNDGLVILDVGNGMKGGSPTNPQFVSQYKYDLTATYARVWQLFGQGFVRGTHTAWRQGRYVFVGDEVYAAHPYKGLQDGNNLTFGRLHVIDVSDITKPREVAWYEPTDGGVHNVWVMGDTLYLGNYQGGARAVDISGELKGDLLREGREMSWILTVDSLGHRRAPFAWGAVVRDGNIFVPDINTGLWILRLEAKQQPVP
ncbi:MAG TPA: Ig-like domain-containing protein [Gemmatimonadales bacterium]|nr:Ig-like domain-containing protein [Gemmatimonadales bacterium]